MLKLCVAVGILMLVLLSTVSALKNIPKPIEEQNNEFEWRKMWLDMEQRLYDDPDFRQALDDHMRDWPPDSNLNLDVEDFDCDVQASDEVPTSVHKLRPGDVKVTSALGDSITAGTGLASMLTGNSLTDILTVILENRGEVWSVGGDYNLDWNVLTLPNVLKEFNPEQKGCSHCVGLANYEKRSKLNVALGGATNVGMESQANTLVERINSDNSIVDVDNDWKIVSIFIGGNDLCRSCRDPVDGSYTAENYVAGVERGLDVLHENLPRTLVNVVPMFDVSPLSNLSRNLFCDVLHRSACSCATDDATRIYLKDLQMDYYYGLKELVDSGKYDSRDDFTVVLQPYVVELTPWIDPETGDWDNSMFAHDCFHLNRKGHQGMALGLWNTMLIPYGDKPLFYKPETYPFQYDCPTEENPYIFTNKNSPEVDSASAQLVSMSLICLGLAAQHLFG